MLNILYDCFPLVSNCSFKVLFQECLLLRVMILTVHGKCSKCLSSSRQSSWMSTLICSGPYPCFYWATEFTKFRICKILKKCILGSPYYSWSWLNDFIVLPLKIMYLLNSKCVPLFNLGVNSGRDEVRVINNRCIHRVLTCDRKSFL